MKRKSNLILAVCVVFFIFSGCNDSGEDKTSQLENIPIDIMGMEQENMENSVQGGTEISSQASENITGNAAGEQTDAELEEELARYRQEREDAIQEANGLVEGGSPDESNYTFDLSGTYYSAQFDTRETTEGYAVARIYVTDTLGINPSTKQVVYMCVDPRMLAIYDDEDKGVAAGYEPEDIFICEYCDNGTWQYLILVREGKGSAWEVIHHGSSFMEEKMLD